MPILPTNPNKKKKNFFGFSPFWMYAALLLVLGTLFWFDDVSLTKEVSYSQFEKYIVDDHGIQKIVVQTDKRVAEGYLNDSLALKLFPDLSLIHI